MKAIKMRIQKFSRPGVILLATVVVIITSIVVANATQTITTPNAALISFSVAEGVDSAPITPVTNKSVLVMGCCTTAGDQSVGQVSLFHSPSGGMAWVGLESTYGAAITEGATSTSGYHIVFIDYFHRLAIQVASANTIKIHNTINSGSTLAGNVTLIW
jgi:hypothetical protein